MARIVTVCLAGLIFVAGAVRGADNPAAGTWKMSFPIQGDRLTFLVMLSESDKGWVGDFLGSTPQLRVEPTVDKVTVKDDAVSFDIKLGNTAFSFDGRVAKDGKKIPGSFTVSGNTFLIDLLPSKLKNLNDKFAVAKEALEQGEGGNEYFDAVFSVLGQATAKKVKPEEVRAIVDKAAKASEAYGARWQRAVALKLANALVEQEAFVAIALEQARQAERMLKPDDDASVQMQVLEGLATTLKKAKKLDDLKPIESRLVKLEARDYLEYSKKFPPFKPEEFKGRKAKNDRVTLVELFTGADCPPCVGVDLAFDALEMTYKPSDVVFLQYHIPANGPDPLSNKEVLERANALRVDSAPIIMFNGRRDGAGGGGPNTSKAKYGSYCETIDESLEKPAGAKIQLSATSKSGEITIKAGVSDVANPGEKVALRFALVEERIRYAGSNGIRFHHSVVRALPGGAKGFPLTKKSSDHTATVNIDKLREEQAKFIEDLVKEDDFTNPERPMAFRNLRVVAFVQDDATGEVLQAQQVEVEDK